MRNSFFHENESLYDTVEPNKWKILKTYKEHGYETWTSPACKLQHLSICWNLCLCQKFMECKHYWSTAVFLSRFWVSKWHLEILQWHPKFWKPRYGFALYWSKTIWRKHVFLHVAIATDGCSVIGRHFFLAQKLEAKIVSLVPVHCHAHRLASASYYIAADLCSMVHETAKAH